METRSKSRGGQLQASSRNVLEDPVARSSTDPEEDLRISTLMDDGAGAAVRGSRPEAGQPLGIQGLPPLGQTGHPLSNPQSRLGPSSGNVPVTETASRLSHTLGAAGMACPEIQIPEPKFPTL